MSKTATFMMNEFTAMTIEDFTKKYTGYNSAAAGIIKENVSRFDYDPKFHYSDNKDYRQDGLLMVKHQKDCGNSYVHSAVGNIEAQYDRKYKLHTVLSEQHAFDCEPFGSCSKGGVPHHVFEYLGKKGGLMQVIHYPAARDSNKQTCQTDSDRIFVHFKKYARFDIDNEQILAAAVDTLGPLCATMFVSESVKNYKSGILDPRDCKKKPTNHAILLMGYGTEDGGIPYWIIKNSWGFDWGEGGYLRLVRGKSACGIGIEYVATVILGDDLDSKSVQSTEPQTIEDTENSEEDRRRRRRVKNILQGHKPFNCTDDPNENTNENVDKKTTTTTTTITTTTTTT
ncbi:thiol protease aleurain-like [Hyposmocoma kahamanoa]|uniref:thiol protease aleurain-like n=1 Tax=Hyposmocoma kahamanoa TaxID=1477025 RepID=UPI000E6D6C51|nr:thiol protease aleurain-like [Hyposmocoma kahamanoa]